MAIYSFGESGSDSHEMIDALDTIASGLQNAGDGVFFDDVMLSSGFTGVSNFDALKSAITTYIDNVQTIIDEYNPNANLDTTIRGKAAEAIHQYVKVTKDALVAYVNVLKLWNSELDKYLEAYHSGDESVQANVQDSVDALQSIVNNFDSTPTGGGNGGTGSSESTIPGSLPTDYGDVDIG